MADVRLAQAAPDDVRAFARRRGTDEAAIRLALASVEAGTAWAALDDGDAVGIAIARDSDGERFAGDLFVEPSYRGDGLGGRLLEAAFADASDARRMLIDPGDVAGAALATRHGFALRENLLSIAGPLPREDALLQMAAGDYRFNVAALDPRAHAFAIDALDLETRGAPRGSDAPQTARDAAGFAFFLDAELVAYAYIAPSGRIGPLAVASASYLTQIFAYTVAALQRNFGATWCAFAVPATATRLVRPALRAGLRIAEVRTIASDEALPDASRYCAAHPILF